MKGCFCKVFCSGWLFLGVAQAYSSVEFKGDPYEKFYVHPDHIAITQDGIYIQLEGLWIKTGTLHQDSTGIFISKADCENYFTWVCPRCHYENGSFTKRCKRCRYPEQPAS
ncbi:MAG: hypothetical protein FJZ63_05050 [Chlamydiae bacterium]|nr:hypothetical protein [Chlamydiota bacterium]